MVDTNLHWRYDMKTAKLFANGRSQAVRLPKDCRFSGTEVYIRKFGDMVVLFSKEDPWRTLINSLDRFSDDLFDAGREQPENQNREEMR